jgi:hypothetical protein
MDWYIHWLQVVLWCAMAPVTLPLSLMGVVEVRCPQDGLLMGQSIWQDWTSAQPNSTETTPWFVWGIIFALPTLMFVAMWPLATMLFYSSGMWNSLPWNGNNVIYVLFYSVIGYGAGMVVARNVLNKIDAHFGFQHRLAGPINLYMMAGAAYMAVKVTKGVGSVIKKI